MSATKTKRSIYNFIFNLLSQIITLGLGIILPRLFLINLGSDVNGLVSSVGQLYAYVGLMEAGIGATTIQALYKPIAESDKSQTNRILSAAGKYYNKIGFYYLVCVVVLSFVYPLIVKSDIPKIQIIGVVFFTGLGGAINFLLQQRYIVLLSAEGKSYIVTSMNMAVNVISSIIKAMLLMMGYNIIVVVASQFIITLLRIVVLKIYIHINYKWLDFKREPDYNSLSQRKYVLIQQLSYFVYSNTDVMILTFFCDLKIVSVYTIYNMIVGVIESVVSSLSSSVVFALGLLYNENTEKFKKIYNIYNKTYMWIVFSLFTVLYIFVTPFLRIYTYGVNDVNYIDQKLAFMFVILKMVTVLRSQSQNAVNFAGLFKKTNKSAIIETILNLTISLAGVYFIGIYGVLLGSIISTFYRGISVTNYVDKHILQCSEKQKYKKYFIWILNLGIFICVVFLTNNRLNYADGYLQLLVYSIIGTIISTLVYMLPLLIIERDVIVELTKIVVNVIQNKFKGNNREKNNYSE